MCSSDLLNASDEDAEKYIKIFTLLSRDEIEELTTMHREAPHQRTLQKKLAEEITAMVHSREDYEAAAGASQILFGQGTAEQLRRLDEKTFLSLFEGVPRFPISLRELSAGINIVDLLTEKTGAFPSKAEVRRTIQANGLSLNKEKVASVDLTVDGSRLLGGKYLLAQKGKKSYFLMTAL